MAGMVVIAAEGGGQLGLTQFDGFIETDAGMPCGLDLRRAVYLCAVEYVPVAVAAVYTDAGIGSEVDAGIDFDAGVDACIPCVAADGSPVIIGKSGTAVAVA